ncbi:unnamed protein product [Ceratitis capitata]|uniref:(Mediterranean fruit fly) hypothetical protein n=1 Tax=Ceratitis capitata TaxID=7213 RepID=A0A811UJD5_CERCA|nr:unnamed protein product [Ceratitis capitata]
MNVTTRSSDAHTTDLHTHSTDDLNLCSSTSGIRNAASLSDAREEAPKSHKLALILVNSFVEPHANSTQPQSSTTKPSEKTTDFDARMELNNNNKRPADRHADRAASDTASQNYVQTMLQQQQHRDIALRATHDGRRTPDSAVQKAYRIRE